MLNFFIYFLTAVLVLVCLLTVLIVLMQRPKQEGLGAAFGGGVTDQMWGAQTTNVLQRGTVYLAILFFCITLLLAVLVNAQQKGTKGTLEDLSQTEPTPPAAETTPGFSDSNPGLDLGGTTPNFDDIQLNPDTTTNPGGLPEPVTEAPGTGTTEESGEATTEPAEGTTGEAEATGEGAAGAVEEATGAVEDAAGAVEDAVEDAAGAVEDAAGAVEGAVEEAAEATAEAVEAVEETSDAPQPE